MRRKTKSFLLAGAFLSASAHTGRGQPVITTQPQSQTSIVGTTATFTVEATNSLPIFYQWEFNTSDLTDQTNTTLVLSNVQPGNAGPYTVIVTNTDGAVTSIVAMLTVLVPPRITSFSPTNQSVSLGANPVFTISASGTPPLYYHLRLNQTDLRGKTNLAFILTAGTLLVTNVQTTNAGDYTVVITNLAGSATSHVAHLDVDPTFTKITTGARTVQKLERG